MENMIKKYKDMLKELKDYGNIIINTANENDWNNFNSLIEIENMDIQFEYCMDILENETK